MAGATPHTFLNVFTVEDYEGDAGKKASRWTRIGVAFPHREGVGFNVELQAFPRDGRLVVLPPNDKDAEEERVRSG